MTKQRAQRIVAVVIVSGFVWLIINEPTPEESDAAYESGRESGQRAAERFVDFLAENGGKMTIGLAIVGLVAVAAIWWSDRR